MSNKGNDLEQYIAELLLPSEPINALSEPCSTFTKPCAHTSAGSSEKNISLEGRADNIILAVDKLSEFQQPLWVFFSVGRLRFITQLQTGDALFTAKSAIVSRAHAQLEFSSGAISQTKFIGQHKACWPISDIWRQRYLYQSQVSGGLFAAKNYYLCNGFKILNSKPDLQFRSAMSCKSPHPQITGCCTRLRALLIDLHLQAIA